MKKKHPHKIVIGLTGEMLSGKTTVVNFLVEHFNAKQLRMSMVLNQILEILDLELSRENQQALANMLRKLFGEEVLAQSLVSAVQTSKHDVLLIDGLRKVKEYEVFQNNIKNFILIYVKSSAQNRFARLKGREEKAGEQYKTLEEFQKSHDAEPEVDIPKLENYANFIINNDGTEQQLQDQVTAAFTQIVM